MSDNKQFLEKRFTECEVKSKKASEAGDYAEFQKWDFEANNIKVLIKMGDEVAE